MNYIKVGTRSYTHNFTSQNQVQYIKALLLYKLLCAVTLYFGDIKGRVIIGGLLLPPEI